MEPFHNLLRKDVNFIWSKECENVFIKIKEYLTSAPVLAVFDRDKPIHIYTDASIEGIGAILKQPQEDGFEKPVAYFSKKLNEAQKKKKAVFIECFAIKEAIKYWQYWLLGNKFVVFSDHKPLENLNVKIRTDEELGDLTNYLSQFDFTIKYNPGQNNAEADCLSRNPVLESNINMGEDILKTVNLLTIDEIKDDQKNMTIEKNEVQENGIIYKTVRGKKKIRLSDTGGKKLIQRIHQEMGHVGMNHLINMSTPYYYSEHMYKQIQETSLSYEICIKNKSRNNRHLGLLGHLGPATKPFEIMSLDTIGGFGGRRSTKRYMHLLVDHFTRYAYITTAKNQTGTDFVKIIKLVQNENKIGTLLTDQYGV